MSTNGEITVSRKLLEYATVAHPEFGANSVLLGRAWDAMRELRRQLSDTPVEPAPPINDRDIERWSAMILQRPEGPWELGNGGSFDRQGVRPISDEMLEELALWLRMGYTPWNSRSMPLMPADRQLMYLLYYSVQGLVSRVRTAERELETLRGES